MTKVSPDRRPTLTIKESNLLLASIKSTMKRSKSWPTFRVWMKTPLTLMVPLNPRSPGRCDSFLAATNLQRQQTTAALTMTQGNMRKHPGRWRSTWQVYSPGVIHRLSLLLTARFVLTFYSLPPPIQLHASWCSFDRTAPLRYLS